jgi:hypothetical protein
MPEPYYNEDSMTWLETLTSALGEPSRAMPESGVWEWRDRGWHMRLTLTHWPQLRRYLVSIHASGRDVKVGDDRPLTDADVLAACRLAGVLPECTCIDISPLHMPRRTRLVPGPHLCPLHPE